MDASLRARQEAVSDNNQQPLNSKQPETNGIELKDLEVESIRNQTMTQPMLTDADLTNEFNDSESGGSYTPLPSIQNNYALQIKSFNLFKKPYAQQLNSNHFKHEFELILGFENGIPGPIFSNRINSDVLSGKSQSQGNKSQEMEYLFPHQKIQLLYTIVQKATTYQKLQDAKDIFDFLMYEIGC